MRRLSHYIRIKVGFVVEKWSITEIITGKIEQIWEFTVRKKRIGWNEFTNNRHTDGRRKKIENEYKDSLKEKKKKQVVVLNDLCYPFRHGRQKEMYRNKTFI